MNVSVEISHLVFDLGGVIVELRGPKNSLFWW